MNVLFLTKYGARAASTRYRVLHYLPHLARAGVHATLSTFFDDAYLQRRFTKGRGGLLDVCRALARRTGALLRARRFDLVVLSYEAVPWLPPVCERYLKEAGIPYVYDYDDAIFHNYDQSEHALIRRLLGHKIGRVISSAALVTAGSRYLADHAARYHPDVTLLPTVVDLCRYPARRWYEVKDRPFTIGWIGSPTTAAYLHEAAPALAAFARERPARLVLVGSGPICLPGVPLTVLPWSEEIEARELAGFDVGIMPLPDTPWARGKCGFKLIQYMAAGVPVIASPVGANRDIVEQGVQGVLARSTGEWTEALCALASDAVLRERLGRAGRARVEERYCIDVTAPRLLGCLLRAASPRNKAEGRGRERGQLAPCPLPESGPATS